MNELALFAGAGGGILGGKLIGWRTVCGVERDAYAATVLAQRQNDGLFAAFPIWSDVTTFDGTRWRGIVDVISGGFPCQDISPAGKQAGIDGERSGLWSEFARIIREVQPRWVFIENSAHLRTKGLGRVLKDLANIGYDAAWGVLSAKDCGANHERKRMWIVAHPNNNGKSISRQHDETQGMQGATQILKQPTNPNSTQREGRGLPSRGEQKHTNIGVGSWWDDTTHLNRMDDEVAYRMDRLKAIGNGQVPLVAAVAFQQLSKKLLEV